MPPQGMAARPLARVEEMRAAAGESVAWRVNAPGPDGQPRAVYVWLPPGFQAHAPLPVVWMADGQNVLEAFAEDSTALDRACRTWHAEQAALDVISRGTRPFAIVGVSSPAAWTRIIEYLPPDVTAFGRRGAADRTLVWLAGELMPRLQSEFPALSRDAAQQTLAGSSMGGLFALYAAVSRHPAFGAAAAMSPSHWRTGPEPPSDGNWAVASLRAMAPADAVARLYLDSGTAPFEAAGGLAVPDDGAAGTAHLARIARECVAWPAEGVAHHIEEGAAHNEAGFGRRLPRVFAWAVRG